MRLWFGSGESCTDGHEQAGHHVARFLLLGKGGLKTVVVHSRNEEMTIRLEDGRTFDAWCSHVENPVGKHLFVVAADAHAKEQLIAARTRLPALVKQHFGIKSNADLDYIECHPDGSLFQVNLDSLGRGPDAHGQPEHTKVEAQRVSTAYVEARLGGVRLPGSPAPPKYVETNVDLTQNVLPSLSKREQSQIRKERKQTQKPRL